VQFLESRIVPFSPADAAFRVAPSDCILRLGLLRCSGLPRGCALYRAGDGSASCPAAPVHWLYR